MTYGHQIWLVAERELRERARSRAFLASLLLMVVVVVAAVVVPEMLDDRSEPMRVGLSGDSPMDLRGAIELQSGATGLEMSVRRYEGLEDGRDAVRDGDIHVLIVDGTRLEWQRRVNDELRSAVSSAIQSLAIRQRAAGAGIDAETLGTLTEPVRIVDVTLGEVAGRTTDDETATFVMTVMLFFALTTYGTMVLTGVVEEKSSRVVEVLLARIRPRDLLAGKIAGIGLLGFGQFALTALAALIAVRLVDSFDIPAVRGNVLAWLVVWFILGFAFYATIFGALGSLASRTEDMQSVAGPASLLLVLVYFVSFATIGSPDTSWARLVSYFPATAPLAMPARMAMGSPAWWEPILAASLTVGAIVGLVRLGGRVYTHAILHTGPMLKLADAWHGSAPRDSASVVIAGETSGRSSRSGGRTIRTRIAKIWPGRAEQEDQR